MFFSAGFDTSISANTCNFLDANHQPLLPSNSYFVRSGITLINANMGQDHFQEHQVQVFAAVTKNRLLNEHSQSYRLQLQPKCDVTSLKLQNVSSLLK